MSGKWFDGPVSARDDSGAALATPTARYATPVLIALSVGVAIPAYSRGALLAIEIPFVVLLPVLVHVLAKDAFLRLLWLVAALWSVAQIVSDLVHGTQLLSAPTLIGPTVALLVTGLYWIYRVLNVDATSVLVAVGMGWTVLELLVGDLSANGNPWKYSLATPVTVTVLAFAYNKRLSTRWILVALALLAGTSLYFDSRFQLALHLVCAGLLIVSRRREELREGQRRRLLLLLIAGSGALYLAYPAVALTGAIGDRAYQQQVKYQAEGANYVLATRMEFPQMLYLVGQNPVLGIGSYGPLASDQAYGALEFVNVHVAPLSENDRSYLLSTAQGSPGYHPHTAAMSAALYAGVLAFPFWIFLFFQLFRALREITARNALAPALTIYVCGLAFWDALFSPLTNQSHVGLAVTLFLCLVLLRAGSDARNPGRRMVTPLS